MPKSKKLTVLGIDPGLARTGYGVIEFYEGRISAKAYGVIETPANTYFPDRLETIYRNMTKLISHWRPDIVALEELFFHRNVTTAFTVGQARGVMILTAIQAKKKIISCKPLQIKRALTGYGQADKKQMQHMVANFLKLKKLPTPDDAADALAVAICGERLAAQKHLT